MTLIRTCHLFRKFSIASPSLILHNARMRITRLANVDPVLKKHPAARRPMSRWVKLAIEVAWNDITETRLTFPTADAIKGTRLTCFNIGGNSFRLITAISYPNGEIAIGELLTHAEYSRKYGK